MPIPTGLALWAATLAALWSLASLLWPTPPGQRDDTHDDNWTSSETPR